MNTTPNPAIRLTIYRDRLTPLVNTGFETVEQAIAEGEWRQGMTTCLGWKVEVDGMCAAESTTRDRK